VRAWKDLASDAFTKSSRTECETVALADWLELQVLDSAASEVSVASLKTALNAGPWNPPGDRSSLDDTDIEAIVSDAVQEIAARSSNYEGHGYPFQLTQGNRVIQRTGRSPSIYEALLAISYINPAPERGSNESGGAVFEALAWLGLSRWLGKPDHAKEGEMSFVHHLGQPSLSGLSHAFHTKIETLARLMRDGKGYRIPHHGRAQRQGDGGVDLLAWRGFPDDQGSQLLIFARYAAGMNFADPGKYAEVDPRRWVRTHFPPGTLLSERSWARCYFIPRMVPPDLNEQIKLGAGVLIDRCRLAFLLHGIKHDQITRSLTWLATTMRAKSKKHAA